MSNNEWSDDEDNNIKQQPEKFFPSSDSESEYEEYDYTKLKCKSYTFDNLNKNKLSSSKKEIKKKEIKQKEYINWYKSDMYKQTNNLNKSNKWVSKRMQNKIGDKIDICKQRQFNPRLPVPNKKNKTYKINKPNNNLKLDNNNEFPKL